MLDKTKTIRRIKDYHDNYFNKIDKKKSRMSRNDLWNYSVACTFQQLIEELETGKFDAPEVKNG